MKHCPGLLFLFENDILGILVMWKYLVQTFVAVCTIHAEAGCKYPFKLGLNRPNLLGRPQIGITPYFLDGDHLGF
jgi:hypothetical protein